LFRKEIPEKWTSVSLKILKREVGGCMNFRFLPGEAAAPNMNKAKELKYQRQNAWNDDSMY
jgi:hypothetical protein